jgi:hypothetical protein
LHEIPDQLGILERLTKWAARIEHPTQTGKLVNDAFRQLRDGRSRPVGRPPHELRRYFASFSYHAQSWRKPWRVLAKVE